jgi:DNA-binding response OmpR family regulator
MTLKAEQNKQTNTLLIGSNPQATQALRASLEVSGHNVQSISSLSEFERTVDNNNIQLVVATSDSSKFKPQELFETVSHLLPETPVVGYSVNPTPENILEFVRCGGADFFCVPDDINIMDERIKTILSCAKKIKEQKEEAQKNAQKFSFMNEEIKRVSEENDSLCNDLANNFCETDKKIQQAAIAAEFQTLVNQELEIESMLRTALGYLLTKIGATNAAVYLHEGGIDWGVGAYINYDRQPEQFQLLVDTIGPEVCPAVSETKTIKKYKNGETFANTYGVDSTDFSGSEVVTLGCWHDDKCMAAIVLFRGDTKTFDEECIDTLETIQNIFGHQLGTILKIHRRGETNWPSESVDDEYWNYGRAA